MKLLNKIKEFTSVILYCFSLSWKSSKLYTIIRIIEKIINPFIILTTTFIGKYIIDILSGELVLNNKKLILVGLVFSLFLLGLISLLFQKIQEYATSMQEDILKKDISNKMIHHAIKADLEFFDNSKYYDAFSAVSYDMHAVVNVMWNAIYFFSSLITAIGIFAILCNINFVYAIILTAVSIPSAIVNQKYTKELYKINLSQINDGRKLNYLYSVATNKQYAEDLRLFNIGEIIKQRYIKLWTQLFVIRKKKIKGKTLLLIILDSLPVVVKFFIILYITMNILNGIGTVGDYSLYTGILMQFSSNIMIISMAIIRIYDDKLRINNVKSFDKITNKIMNNGKQHLSDVNKIEFRNVCFTYPNTDKVILNNINFTIENKEKVALVGVNGAGKSTIIKLLLRFYDVDSGNILINDIDIHEYELINYRRAFSTCFQNPTIYGFSLKENIILGDLTSKVDDDRIINAMKESDVIDILGKAPNGLDTFLTRSFENDGIELSGGQYQKVTLARTFYRDSKAIILDEPSSSLDPEAEHKVFEALNKLCENKTTLFTSHRLSNIYIADKIVVIEDGEIIEQGTHEELIKNPKRYAVLYKYQSDKFNTV